MIFTQEVSVSTGEDDYSEDDESNSGSEGSEAESESVTARRNTSFPMPNERLTITVLDRLWDAGSNLIQLAICLEFEDHWVRANASLTS